MRCARCGTVNPGDTSRCVGCGGRLVVPARTTRDATVAPGGDAATAADPSRDALALGALICGLLSVIPCAGTPLALAAVVLGYAWLRRARNVPEARGRAQAWAGIVLGSLVMLMSAGYMCLMLAMGWLD